MPNFDFKCQYCNKIFELNLPKHRDKVKCIYCENQAERQYTVSNMHLDFRGTGFYTTDYKGKK